jgi:hypothetical protein
MSVKTNWTATGVKLEDSIDSFMKSVQHVSNSQVLKKYENRLNKSFKENIRRNLRQAGIGDRQFDEVFFLKITNNGVVFTNTDPLITQRYEYGYYESNKTSSDEYYDDSYMIGTSPRYFIRPAMQKTMQEVGELLIQEANQYYMMNRRQSNGDDVY